MLDKQSPVPLYYQLYSILLKEIHDGTYRVGEALPTEARLMDAYEISRATVRQAIGMLVNKGYLEGKKSKGTYVKEYEQNVLYKGKVRGFTAETKERQIPLKSVILEKKVMPATKTIQECLGLGEGDLVFYLKRLRYINSEPNTLVEDYLPFKLCNGIEVMSLENDSLYETLEQRFHLLPHHARRIFESVRPSSKEEIELLSLTSTSSILAVESYVYMSNGDCLEYYTARVKGKYIVDV